MNIVAGGYDGSKYLDSVEVNVAEQDNWRYGTKIPTAMVGLSKVGLVFIKHRKVVFIFYVFSFCNSIL